MHLGLYQQLPLVMLNKGYKGTTIIRSQTLTMMDGGKILIIAIWEITKHNAHASMNKHPHTLGEGFEV